MLSKHRTTHRLPDVVDLQEGPGIMAADFRDTGVPLIRLAGLDPAAPSVLAGCNFLDPDTVARRWSHFRVQVGDTLLSTSASLGRIAIVGDGASGSVPYTGIIRMRPRTPLLAQEYIRYLLAGVDFQQQIEALGVGSVIRHFGPSHLRRVMVSLPDVAEQRRIAGLLGALDDKIELNRRMSRTLEEIAQTIFKAWFIDFEGCDDLVESELGPIPRGWSAGRVDDFAALNPEVWRGREAPKTIHYLDLTNVKWGEVGEPQALRFADAPSRARRILANGDTVIGTVRPANGSYGLILSPEPGLTASTGFAVLRPRRTSLLYFNYLWLTRRSFIDYLGSVADGCAYPAVRPEVIATRPMLRPTEDVLTRFHDTMAPLFARREVCRAESRTLAALRDLLLPKLISGELRIPEAEKAVEASL